MLTSRTQRRPVAQGTYVAELVRMNGTNMAPVKSTLMVVPQEDVRTMVGVAARAVPSLPQAVATTRSATAAARATPPSDCPRKPTASGGPVWIVELIMHVRWRP